MGSPTKLDESGSELFMPESVAMEVKGKVGVNIEAGAGKAGWFDEQVGSVDDVDGRTAGRGRNRWARLDIDIISTISLD